MPTKLQVLERYFGYPSFREGQEELIDTMLRGKDAVGIMPTGAGKSLCFQVPALLLPGITLVISPLISLMKDQVSALVQNGIRGAYLNSSLTLPQYRAALRNAKAGMYKIIYVAPERLMTPDFQDFVQHVEISMVTVDEAHCVSQWGQDFRPSYLSIPEFVRSLPRRPVVSAFTATATPRVREDILSLLALKDPQITLTGFDRPNLYYDVQIPKDKPAALLKLLRDREDKSGIVYCSTRKAVEEVWGELTRAGFSASYYHGGLDDETRRKHQEDFLYDRSRVMVATNAFGMGIDKSNVSFVIHYNMPMDLESYYQEAGRAGRDGSPADCILLYSPGDVRLNRYIFERSLESQELDEETRNRLISRSEERLKTMTVYCRTTSCLRKYILGYFGESSPIHCNNCRNCSQTFTEVDAFPEAREICVCVRHLRGHFGVKLILDLLRGSKSEKLRRFGLDRYPSYGKLSRHSEAFLREVMENLLAEGYLCRTSGGYPVIKPGEKIEEILRGKGPLLVRFPAEAAPKRPSPKTGSSNPKLFSRLRALRGKLADKQNVPPFVVFSNACLEDMSIRMPQTPEEFLQVSGVGRAKLQRYGDIFMEEIRRWMEETGNA